MAITLRDILAQVCAVKQCWFSGVSTGLGTATTLVCSSLIGRVHGAGQRVQVANVDREIVAFDRNSGTVTFRPGHSSAIASGAAFTVTPWRWDEMVAAVVRAMYAMGDSWRMTRATESQMSLDGLHQTWDLPSDCESVIKVQVKGVGNVANVGTLGHVLWQDYPYYTVVNVDGARKLQLKEHVAGPILVQYQALITIPNEPNDYVQFGDNDDRDAVGFVVNRALSELLMSDAMVQPVAENARVLREMAASFKGASEAIRAAHKPAQWVGMIKRRPFIEHV